MIVASKKKSKIDHYTKIYLLINFLNICLKNGKINLKNLETTFKNQVIYYFKTNYKKQIKKVYFIIFLFTNFMIFFY